MSFYNELFTPDKLAERRAQYEVGGRVYLYGRYKKSADKEQYVLALGHRDDSGPIDRSLQHKGYDRIIMSRPMLSHEIGMAIKQTRVQYLFFKDAHELAIDELLNGKDAEMSPTAMNDFMMWCKLLIKLI